MIWNCDVLPIYNHIVYTVYEAKKNGNWGYSLNYKLSTRQLWDPKDLETGQEACL